MTAGELFEASENVGTGQKPETLHGGSPPHIHNNGEEWASG